jgi:uncharacterized protein (TIGR03086 family)
MEARYTEMANQTNATTETPGQLYVRAMRSTQRFVAGVRPDQWGDPTPCTEWTVRDVLNHITNENLWAAELFPGKTIAEVGNRLDGDLLGNNPRAAFDRSVEAARAEVEKPGAMEAATHLSFGDTPGAEYARQLFLDLLIHGWDIAKGAGQDAQLEPDLVAACIPVAEQLTAMVGDGGAYGSKLKVDTSVDPQTRLLAILGRRSDWSAP